MASFNNKAGIHKELKTLAEEISAYQAASNEIRDMLETKDLAQITDPMESVSVDWSSLSQRQRQRISRTLGRDTRARIEADADDPRTGFSLETYTQTVLPREDVIEEARIAALDFDYTLGAEDDPKILTAKAHDFVAQASPGYEALAAEQNHQSFIDQLFAALAVQSADLEEKDRQRINGVLSKRKGQSVQIRERIQPCWQALTNLLKPDVTFAASPGAEPRQGSVGTHRPQTQQSEDQSMAQENDEARGDQLVDAISRLQEGGAGVLAGGPAGGTASSDGSKALDQQIYASLGLPNLRSDTAQAMDRGQLADKLFLGLDRTVVRETTEIGARFRFNPTQARALVPIDGGAALGAQGVVAETVTTLKPAILRCLRLLQPEVCHCSENEVDDLIADVELGLDLLAGESRSSSGIFRIWAATLIRRIASDVIALVAIYGIQLDLPRAAARLIKLRIGKITIIDDGPLNSDPAVIDRDVGFLAREANDQAVRTIFEHIATIAHLIRDLEHMPRGPLTVRLRAVIEAIPPAVADARSALNVAGLSETDRAAEYLPNAEDPFGIELARLLDLTETTANEWRVRLLEEDLNKRDLGWLLQTLQTLVTGLRGVDVESETKSSVRAPTINRNRYALGARQLRELADHVNTARRLVKRLYAEIDDRGPARGKSHG